MEFKSVFEMKVLQHCLKGAEYSFYSVCLFLFFLLFQSIGLNAQCNCNDNVQLSLGPDGEGIITPNLILENQGNCPGVIEIRAIVNGNYLNDTLDCTHLDQTVPVEVFVDGQSTCLGSVLVKDKLAPFISCRDTLLPCGASPHPDTLGYASVSDNCDPDPQLFYSDEITMDKCSGGSIIATIRRTWGAKDTSNNLSVTCVQNIHFKTDTLQNIVFPSSRDGIVGPMLDCSNPDTSPNNTGFPTIDGIPVGGFCKLGATYQDQLAPICAGSYKILRKWIVVDCCTGEDTSAYQVIKVMDSTKPTIVCPDTLTYFATNNDCTASFYLPRIRMSDDCTDSVDLDVKIFYPGGQVNVNGGPVMNLPVDTNSLSVTVSDDCGNDTTCNFVIIVKDITPPAPVCVEYLNAPLNSNGMNCIPATSFDVGTTDDCCMDSIRVKRMGEPDSAFDSFLCVDCTDYGSVVMTVVRFWDCHGNYNDCMTEVRIQDKIAPTLNCPSDTLFSCAGDYRDSTLTGIPVVDDNCSVTQVNFSDDSTDLNMCKVGDLIRTWTAIDQAGLMSTCTQTIHLVDTTPYVLNFPADDTLICPALLDTLGYDTFNLAVGDCESFAYSKSESFDTLGCTIIMNRTFRIIEWCSDLDTSYTQKVYLMDTIPPVFDQIPGSLDTTLTCSNADYSPFISASDACNDPSSVTLASLDSIPGICENNFTYRYGYTATDACANETKDTFFVNVTFIDTIPPEFTVLPRDTTVDCDKLSTVPNYQFSIQDDCSNVSLLFSDRDIQLDSCPIVGRHIETYIAVDGCDQRDTVYRTITLVDLIAPTADSIPDSTYQCYADIPAPNTAVITGESDNCSPVTIVFMGDSLNNRCNDTLIRTYRLIDTCQNFRDIEQRYIILDTVPPRLTCPAPPAYDTLEASTNCEVDLTGVIATAIDLCDGANVLITNDSQYANDTLEDASGTYPVGRHLITFTATDSCGNQETCQLDFLVRDTMKPKVAVLPQNGMPDTISLDINGNLVIDSAFIANHFIDPAGTFDECSGVSLTSFPGVFDCSNLGLQNLLLLFQDASFNGVTYFPYVITIVDSFSACSNPIPSGPMQIIGAIQSNDGRQCGAIDVTLSNANYFKTSNTGSTGWYVFDSIPAGSYDLKPEKNTGFKNGVSTLDIILIAKHILNVDRLNDPYKMIAADVNNSGTITTLDLLELRKLLLGKIPSFKNNSSWRFVDAAYQFRDPLNPFEEDFPEYIHFEDLHESPPISNFISIKIGDVNQDAQMLGNGFLSSRDNRASQSIFALDNEFVTGQKLLVPFFINEASIKGYQFSLNIEDRYLKFEGSKANYRYHFSEDNYALLDQDEKQLLNVSWSSDQSISDTLFLLSFTALTDGKLSDAIEIEITKGLGPEAYDENLNIRNIELEFISSESDVAPMFELFQNQPNPFTNRTQLGFKLKSAMKVSLEIFEISGKLVHKIEGEFKAGRHYFPLDAELLEEKGVYLYQLTTPFGASSKRMIGL